MDKRYGYNWNEAAVERLKTLWFSGFTALEIGRIFGVSRNSIIGKAHRLGWTGMQRKKRPKLAIEKKVAALDAPPPEPKPKRVHAPAQLLTSIKQVSKHPAIGSFGLMDLRYGVCKWPEGEQPPYSYCGAPALENGPYCPDHHRRAHQGPHHRALRPIESYAIRRSRQAA
jgi:GcrA cell cycle regulator